MQCIIILKSAISAATESNQPNAAALRAFRLLDYVDEQPDGCTPTQVVTALGLPKQTVHRIIKLAGLLLREPGSQRVQLGARLTRFAENILMHGHASRERHAILQSLVDDIGETCNLTALAGTHIVYIERVETAWPFGGSFLAKPGRDPAAPKAVLDRSDRRSSTDSTGRAIALLRSSIIAQGSAQQG